MKCISLYVCIGRIFGVLLEAQNCSCVRKSIFPENQGVIKVESRRKGKEAKGETKIPRWQNVVQVGRGREGAERSEAASGRYLNCYWVLTDFLNATCQVQIPADQRLDPADVDCYLPA